MRLEASVIVNDRRGAAAPRVLLLIQHLEESESESPGVTRMTMRFRAIASILCLVVAAASASAQTVTTGSVAGVVTDAQGGVLPGATVTAVHTPTGTSYEAVTDADGRYNILNVRVGPYTVTAVMSGFKKEETPNVAVGLGEQKTIDFKLPLESLTETVEVVGLSSIIDSSRAGT